MELGNLVILFCQQFSLSVLAGEGDGHRPAYANLEYTNGPVEMMLGYSNALMWLMVTSSFYNKDKIFKLPTSRGNTLLLSGINASNVIICTIKTRITILCY